MSAPKIEGMEKMVALAMALAVSVASAATTRMLNGVEYVNAKEFAQENKLTFKSDAKGILLKSGTMSVVMFPFAKVATANGIKFTLAAPPQTQSSTVLVPLNDVRKVFGIKDAIREVTIRQDSFKSTNVKAAEEVFEVHKKNKNSGFDLKNDYFGTQPVDITAANISPKSLYEYCQNRIHSRLKSPITAIYESGYVDIFADQAWQVVAAVNAQNDYGAMLRNNYYCKFKLISGSLFMAWDLY